MAQLLVMPAPYMNAERKSHDSSSSCRNSSRQRITYAKISKSSISPVNAVACSQNVSWSPQTARARIAGIQVQPGRRTAPHNETERARRVRVRAAQAAVKRLSAKGSHAGGKMRKKKRMVEVMGWRRSGCQDQPET